MADRSILTFRIGLFVLAFAVIAPTAFAQSGQGRGASSDLASEDVSEKEVQAAAEIIVAMQMQRQELRKEMMEKYGNPQEMDSTRRRQARAEMMKKRQALMQKKTEEEGLSAKRLGLIMKSARQDSTLRERVNSAVREKRQSKMVGSTPQQQGGDRAPADSSGGSRR